MPSRARHVRSPAHRRRGKANRLHSPAFDRGDPCRAVGALVWGRLTAEIANDSDFRFASTNELDLNEKEVAFLLDEKEDSHPVRHLMERIAKVRGMEPTAPRGRLDATEELEPPED